MACETEFDFVWGHVKFEIIRQPSRDWSPWKMSTNYNLEVIFLHLQPKNTEIVLKDMRLCGINQRRVLRTGPGVLKNVKDGDLRWFLKDE